MTLFNHTADIKAQNRAILWYVLNLTQFKDNSKKNAEFEWLFPGKTFEIKEAVMFDYEENKNEIYEKCYSKLASIGYVLSLLFTYRSIGVVIVWFGPQ